MARVHCSDGVCLFSYLTAKKAKPFVIIPGSLTVITHPPLNSNEMRWQLGQMMH